MIVSNSMMLTNKQKQGGAKSLQNKISTCTKFDNVEQLLAIVALLSLYSIIFLS